MFRSNLSTLQIGVAIGLAVLVAVVLSSCGGPEEEAAPAETTSTSVASTTSTTAATTTTTEPTTTTTADPEDAVLAVHTRFMTEFFARDETETSPLDRLPLAEELTVDPQLARSTESIEGAAEVLDREYVISPGYDSNVIEVEIDEDSAFVLDCSLDQGTLYSADGEVLIGVHEDDYRIRRTNLVLIDGQWFISEFFTGGGEKCDPAA